jgi:uncharacterized protein YggE
VHFCLIYGKTKLEAENKLLPTLHCLKSDLDWLSIAPILCFMGSILSLTILPGDLFGSKGSDRVTIRDLLPFDPSTQLTATDIGSQILNKSTSQTGTVSSTDQARNGNTSYNADITEHTISVKGSGVIQVEPDFATVSLSIISSKGTEKASLDANSATFDAVKNFLTKNVINYKNQNSNIYVTNTSSLSTKALSIKQDNLSMYTVVRNIVISTSNLSNIPYWIAEVGKLGVNRLDKIQFNLTNENTDKERINVMERAMGDAWAKARDAAILLGVKVIGVKSLAIDNFAIREQFSYPQGFSPTTASSWFRDFTPSINLETDITQSFLFKAPN